MVNLRYLGGKGDADNKLRLDGEVNSAPRFFGRGAAPLAEDAALLPGEPHDVLDGQEVGGVFHLGDQAEPLKLL